MTAEQRTLIAPGDIVAIELECEHCHSRVRHTIEKIQTDRLKVMTQCPSCKEQLLQPHNDSPEANRLINFIDALRALIRNEGTCILRLEIPPEEKKA
jgi:hypothetical protein